MIIEKLAFTDTKWQKLEQNIIEKKSVDLVFVFGDIDSVERYNHYKLLQNFYPKAHIVISSTAGNILDTSIDTYSAVATAISFKNAYVKVSSIEIQNNNTQNEIQTCIDSLQNIELKHLFFFGPGIQEEGDFLDSLTIQNRVSISGGFGGDSFRFDHTYQQYNNSGSPDTFIIVGLYGSSLHIETSSETGWQEFGSQRVITKAKNNIVYEIDNQPAIELYRRYLGTKTDNLPKNALRFPLSIKDDQKDKQRVIRALMKVNKDESLTFSAAIKEGSIVKLMKTNVHNTLDSAFLASKKIRPFNTNRSLTLIVSCCARRNVLKQFSEEEVEIIQDILTSKTQIIGFYSYGEIAPLQNKYEKSRLKNQTITITTIYEE